jgi:plasmid stability protein
MAQVLIRDVDEATVERLRERAKNNGRSLEAELRLVLRSAARLTPEEFLESVARTRARLGGRRFSDSADLIREDRDQR